MMGAKSSRREFLKQMTVAGATAACASLIPGDLAAAAAGGKSRLVIARNKNVLGASGEPADTVHKDALAALLDRTMAKLTGEASANAAWKSLFHPDDVVGVKVNCLFGPGACTHPEVAHAVAGALVRAGVKPSNVIIWDRSTGDLLKCGYRINTEGNAVRVLANDDDWEAQPTHQGEFGGRLTKILSQITALINIPMMKDHNIAGISGALKNHYGTCNNPGDHHGNHCDPYLAHLNAIPAIRNKTRLVVMDALRPMADGGPALKRDALWDYYGLIVSRDPVAVDYTALKTIDERRVQVGLKPISESERQPKWIATAAGLGLGTNDPAKMDVLQIA